jgi:hypothetical protein
VKASKPEVGQGIVGAKASCVSVGSGGGGSFGPFRVCLSLPKKVEIIASGGA